MPKTINYTTKQLKPLRINSRGLFVPFKQFGRPLFGKNKPIRGELP
jgi:hypothetical protein